MATTVNMHEAKTRLSKLVKLVEQGDEVVIARAGKPVARLCRVAPPGKKKLPYGALAGIISLPDDFDDPVEEMDGPIFP